MGSVLDVLYCIHIVTPVTKENMSYVSVVFTGLVGLIMLLCFTTKRGVFTGPKFDMVKLTKKRLAALHGGNMAEVKETVKTKA